MTTAQSSGGRVVTRAGVACGATRTMVSLMGFSFTTPDMAWERNAAGPSIRCGSAAQEVAEFSEGPIDHAGFPGPFHDRDRVGITAADAADRVGELVGRGGTRLGAFLKGLETER